MLWWQSPEYFARRSLAGYTAIMGAEGRSSSDKRQRWPFLVSATGGLPVLKLVVAAIAVLGGFGSSVAE